MPLESLGGPLNHCKHLDTGCAPGGHYASAWLSLCERCSSWRASIGVRHLHNDSSTVSVVWERHSSFGPFDTDPEISEWLHTAAVDMLTILRDPDRLAELVALPAVPGSQPVRSSQPDPVTNTWWYQTSFDV